MAGGTTRNYEYLTSRVDFDGLDEPDRIILCDAQTSGGLLIAVSPARVDALESALTRRGVIAARIGEISGDGDGRITIEA